MGSIAVMSIVVRAFAAAIEASVLAMFVFISSELEASTVEVYQCHAFLATTKYDMGIFRVIEATLGKLGQGT